MAIDFPSSPSTNDTFTAGSITYKWDGDKWVGLGVTPADRLVEGSNKLEIDANNHLIWTGDNVGINDTSPDNKLHITTTSSSAYSTNTTNTSNLTNALLKLQNLDGSDGTGANNYVGIQFSVANGATSTAQMQYVRTGDNAGKFEFKARNTSSNYPNIMTLLSSGNVGINRTDPDQRLNVNGNIELNAYDSASGAGGYFTSKGLIIGNAYDAGKTGLTDDRNAIIWQERGLDLDIATNDALRMKITYEGQVLIGTSSLIDTSVASNFQIASSSGPRICIARNDTDTDSGNLIGAFDFYGNHTATSGGYELVSRMLCEAEGDHSDSSKPTRLAFYTCTSGSDAAVEKMRLSASGTLFVGPSNYTWGTPGARLSQTSDAHFCRADGNVVAIRRNTNDGTLIDFYQDGGAEGAINVSGSTVSLVGGHLSRWTQLPGNAERTEILRGTVLSNLDEMCEWGDEDNEQLNRMEVSEIEGDVNVAGVFQSWDDDDDTYTNDFYCAMTGDFVIRIAQGTTVARGDLLMSAGDGTAKPQDDDIIRSKTIAKVTSTNVSETYEDGSYCVPCVLMAC